MRITVFIIAAALLSSCANAPANRTVTAYDAKGNVRYVAAAPGNEFVGTSAEARAPAKAPAWARFGHP